MVSFILSEHRNSVKEGLLTVALHQTRGLTLVRERRAKNALHQNLYLAFFTIEEGEEGPEPRSASEVRAHVLRPKRRQRL
jgi:hypothetical protein